MMKVGLKFFSLKIVIIAFFFLAAAPIYSQEECNNIYQNFADNRRGPEIDKYQTAIASGKEYLEKCGNLHPGSDVNNYVTDRVSKMEAIVKLKLLKECESIYQRLITFDGNLKEGLLTAKEYL